MYTDWKEVSGEASVGDLVAFDTLLASLPEDQQLVINRKIKHEVEWTDRATVHELRTRVGDLKAAIVGLRKELADLSGEASR
jgi:hypothetical protein